MADDALASRLRMVAALARCPVAALYRVDGERAYLVAAHAPESIRDTLAVHAPAWRLARREALVVPIVGRGPAAPESALFPAAFGVTALINAPIRTHRSTAALLLVDSRARPDLSELDRAALDTAVELLAEALDPVDRDTTGVRRSEPYREESLPPEIADTAAWPIEPVGHDPVTGLPDRRLIVRATDAAIVRANGRGIAIAIVALDRFQRIDDWLGRAVGDELLRQVAERLLDTTSEHDLVGRGTGDEILVVFTNLRVSASPVALADRLLHAFREPFHVRGYELSLTATVGVSRSPEDAADATTLLRYAGIALHRAKHRRQGRLELFTPELKDAVERRGDVERNLRRAIGAGELRLHYQPKVELRERRTTGVEALLRWQHRGAMVSPAHFLPVAEESELIVPIGTWVLIESCRQMRAWLARGLGLTSVSVNVSALQFSRSDFVGTVERALSSAGLAPSHLELEITETSLMDDVDAAAERLGALRAMGVRVSVDDFGTGYSSLAYLQRFPVDVIKIDRSFVKDLDAIGPARDQARALAHAITGLGHNLGLRVLAEGVETEAQLDAVIALGCDEVQGFYFSRPLPPDEIEARVR